MAELGFGVNSTVWLCRDLRQGFELHLQLVKILSNILIGNEAFGMPALNSNLSTPPSTAISTVIAPINGLILVAAVVEKVMLHINFDKNLRLTILDLSANSIQRRRALPSVHCWPVQVVICLQ